MTLCVEKRPIEALGIMRRLSWVIELMAGNLDAYELLQPIHDETVIVSFRNVKQKLEITDEQFFMGCAVPAQLKRYKRILGFVQCPDGVWIHSRCNGRFEADAPGIAHMIRNPGDIILAPAFQSSPPSVILPAAPRAIRWQSDPLYPPPRR